MSHTQTFQHLILPLFPPNLALEQNNVPHVAPWLSHLAQRSVDVAMAPAGLYTAYS